VVKWSNRRDGDGTMRGAASAATKPDAAGTARTAAAEAAPLRRWVAKYVTANLAYVVEIERYKAKTGGRDDITPVALRVTSIFRLEEGVWKL
jgi:hypothetical protein